MSPRSQTPSAVYALPTKSSAPGQSMIFLFHGEVVGDSVAGLHRAATFYHATLEEHRLSECGLAGSLSSEKSYVFDFVGVVNPHIIMDF